MPREMTDSRPVDVRQSVPGGPSHTDLPWLFVPSPMGYLTMALGEQAMNVRSYHVWRVHGPSSGRNLCILRKVERPSDSGDGNGRLSNLLLLHCRKRSNYARMTRVNSPPSPAPDAA